MQVEPDRYVFEGNPVRVIWAGGEPWFAAEDVVQAVGCGERFDDLFLSVSDAWKRRITVGEQPVWCASDWGIYALLMQCAATRRHAPLVPRFQQWFAGEVLPKVRSVGLYAPGRTAAERLTILAQRLVDAEQRLQVIDREREQVVAARRALILQVHDATPQATGFVGEIAIYPKDAPLPVDEACHVDSEPAFVQEFLKSPKEVSLRERIQETVDDYVAEHHLTDEQAAQEWRGIFASLKDRTGVDLRKMAKNRSYRRKETVTPLDVAEEVDAGAHPGTLTALLRIALLLNMRKVG